MSLSLLKSLIGQQVLGLLGGQGASAPTENPTLTFDQTIGQGATATFVTNNVAVPTEYRWYKDDVLQSALTGDTTHLFSLADSDVNAAWKVGAYYASIDTEFLSEPVYVPFLGATNIAITSRYTTSPELTWTRLVGGGGSDTYDVVWYLDGSPVSLTGDEDIDGASYTVSSALTAYNSGYTYKLVSAYGSYSTESALVQFTPAPYVLLDEMTAEIALGSLDNSYASDGVHQRTATDTSTVGVQTGGKVYFPNGGQGTTLDPRMSYDDAFTRAAGLLVHTLLRSTGSQPSRSALLGLHNSIVTSTNLNQQAGWAVTQNGRGLIALDSYVGAYVKLLSAGVDYPLIAALKGTGWIAFMKDPALDKWTLVNYTPNGNTASLYLQMGSADGQTISVDDVVSPAIAYLPTPVVSDGFSDASAPYTSDGLGHSADSGVDEGGDNVSWTDTQGTWQNSGGKANATALDGGTGFAMRTFDASKADVLMEAKATLTDTSKMVGVLIYVDASNYAYFAYTYNGSSYQIQITQVVAGTPSNLLAPTNANSTMFSDPRMKFLKVGTSLNIYFRSREFPNGGYTTYTLNAVFGSATKFGLITTDTTATFDNLVLYAYGSNDEYAILDSYLAALTPTGSLLDDPPTTTLSLTTNPGGADIQALIDAEGEGGSLELTTQGIYTIPAGNSLIIPDGFTLSITTDIYVFIQCADGTPPTVSWGAGAACNALVDSKQRLYIGGIPGGGTGTHVFATPGGQTLTGLGQLNAWNGMVVGYAKYNCTFSDFVQLGCGYESYYHANYVAEADGAGQQADKAVTFNDFIIVRTGAGGGAGCAYRIGHQAYGVEVHGGFVGQADMIVYEGDAYVGNLYDQVVFWSGRQPSVFKSDVTITNSLIGLAAAITGSYPSATISDNVYPLAQTLSDDADPHVMTGAQITSTYGYSIGQVDEAVATIKAMVDAVVDASTLATFWSELPILEFYLDILRTVNTNHQTYIAGL